MDRCYPDPVTIATVVIAIATVINMAVAVFQWNAARRSANVAEMIFEAGNRPYVGVKSIICIKDSAEKCLRIFAVIKNFGTATAENCDVGWKMYLNGVIVAGTSFPANTTALFPKLSHHLRAILCEPYSQITSGASILEITVHFPYSWKPKQSHIYEEKYRYEHSENAFMGLGVVTGDSKSKQA